MSSKTKTYTAQPARNPGTVQKFGIGDAGSANPNCVYAFVTFLDTDGNSYSTLTWFETTSDGGQTQQNANGPGLTSAQINTLKTQLVAIYNLTLTANGFV